MSQFHARRTLALLGLLAAGPAAAATCEDLAPSTVSIKRIELPTVTNLDYSYKALKGMSADYAKPNQQVLGLTRGKSQVRFNAHSAVVRTPSGLRECASHQLIVSYGFDPLTVYVGREFPPGTCAYEEIYQHELKHVRTYQEHAQKIESEISEALSARFANAPPSRGAAGETQEKLNQEINERWLPYIKRLLDQAISLQREVDSPEEYARVAQSCDGAIRKILGGRPPAANQPLAE